MAALRLWADKLNLWSPPKPDNEPPKDSGDGWATIAGWQGRMAGRRLDEDSPLLPIIAEVTDGSSTVLDIGAGGGRLAVPLAAKVKQVIAVEASPSMRRVMEERIAGRGAANVEVLAGRWPAVDVPPVDVAYCAHVVYDVSDLGPFLLKMNEVARRRCFVELTPRHPLDAFRELWQEFLNWTPPDGPTYLDAVACLRQLGIEPQVQVIAVGPRLAFADAGEATAFYQDRLGLTNASPKAESLRQRVAGHGSLRTGNWIPDWQFDETIILSWLSQKRSSPG